jgi:hypothetical protein
LQKNFLVPGEIPLAARSLRFFQFGLMSASLTIFSHTPS